ncbi:Uncharacterised protein [Oligella ureolytica]|uniref:Helix-turn-helix domain n=1 Tax=Oligella ureolytica TaxID=90244 RepID=A0A378XE08_9BURK|nr:hypothetical protein [Oligella ureolytica]QPT40921.1 hypothetical protein I6G29_05020 [Oligella ureolytica]SUA53186.1 Uncharacterised protein [Oligella ureolytica]SUA57614.1 Uncharacterised protein [Oligella ureolytica]
MPQDTRLDDSNQTNNRHPELDRYWTMKEIADHLGVSIHTPRAWLRRKQMPRPDINGVRLNRWRYSTIKDFLDDPIAWREENKGLEVVK